MLSGQFDWGGLLLNGNITPCCPPRQRWWCEYSAICWNIRVSHPTGHAPVTTGWVRTISREDPVTDPLRDYTPDSAAMRMMIESEPRSDARRFAEMTNPPPV